jgi:Tfp pilus assembly protein PilN
MEKIYINLSPKAVTFDSAILKKFSYYLSWAAASLLALVLILGILAANRAAKCNSYQAKWKSWEDKSKTLAEIKRKLLELENEKNEFQIIVTPQNKIADIFEDLFVSLPTNIWFDALSLKKDSLSLKGYVVRVDEDYLASLEKFINSLKKREYFSTKFKKINIVNSQKNNYNGAEVLEFNIECLN